MTYVTVEVDSADVLANLSDKDIEDEYESRFFKLTDTQILQRIWIHDREGRKEEAYTLMREYVLEKLGKVL